MSILGLISTGIVTILVMTISFNQTNSPLVDLLAVAVIAFLLLGYLSFIGA